MCTYNYSNKKKIDNYLVFRPFIVRYIEFSRTIAHHRCTPPYLSLRELLIARQCILAIIVTREMFSASYHTRTLSLESIIAQVILSNRENRIARLISANVGI